jgi:hypothetical protein
MVARLHWLLPALLAATSFPLLADSVIPNERQERSGEADDSIQWGPLLKQAGLFLGIQHGFRLATEPGTREGMKGPFFKGWAKSVSSLHGFADGDPFYVNYIGHPMQGAVTGYLLVQNDPKFRAVEYSGHPDYWKSRLRALAFSFAYSTQFEVGPFSEATIGKIQSRYPQQGFVDHVVTPAIGMGWMVTEDIVDRYLVENLEARIGNPYLRLLLRGGLNPSRSMANMMRGKVPWYRDSRTGVFRREIEATSLLERPRPQPRPDGRGLSDGLRFEFGLPFQTSLLGGVTCLGGGGTAAWRVSSSWDFVFEATGCKLLPPGYNVSGDSLTYLAGPRWTPRMHRWSPHLQVMAGGHRIAMERLHEQRRAEIIATEGPDAVRARYLEYLDRSRGKGVAVAVGGGLDYDLNRALAFRVTRFEYMRSWMPPVRGIDYAHGMRLTTGLVLKVGTW